MVTSETHGRRRFAIVGSGISGLLCAYLLGDQHDITVYEANGYIGGHTNTVDVDDEQGVTGVDTGFIVYNETNYPNFSKLLGRLGVETQPSNMSLSVRCDRCGLEYNGSSLNRLFAQRRNLLRPAHHRMVRDILRFFREAPRVLENNDLSTTVAEYVQAKGYSKAFETHYLLPIGASLWSCPEGTFRGFPIRFVVEFFHHHGMLLRSGRPEWRVVTGGSARYVEAMTSGFRERIRLSTPVRSVARDESGVNIRVASGETERFDHAILACHSDQALAMLADPTDDEREVLGAIPYETNRATLHTDTTILPKRRLAWGSWNYHVREDPDTPASVTYNMNMLQTLATRSTYCVTLNEDDAIDPDRVIASFEYDHPVFSAGRVSAQRRRGELVNANRTSYCGAYWGYGFHEDGVRSALDVCRSFGVTL